MAILHTRVSAEWRTVERQSGAGIESSVTNGPTSKGIFTFSGNTEKRRTWAATQVQRP